MLNKRLALDLGTSMSRIILEGHGIIADEPTVVAVSQKTNKVLAIGEQAKQMIGRSGDDILAIRPLENGAISDYHTTEILIAHLFRKALGSFFLFKPEVMIATPISTTQVEKRTLIDAAISAGARQAYLIEQPLAAAIGAKISLASPTGSMMVSIGAGCEEAIVISSGGIIASSSHKFGSEKIDKTIVLYLKKKHNLVIGENTAEKIKQKLVNATLENIVENEQMEVNGQDAASGMPKTIVIKEEEISLAVSKNTQEIITCIKKVFENTPPELSADIIDKGIMLSGGGSKLKNLNKLIMQATGLSCHVAQNPELCTVLGCSQALENLEEYENFKR